MAFNGSGVFVRLYNWVNDAAANIKIRADRMDNEMNDFATGLSTCITKDGQTTVIANLPMAGFRHTGVGDATARTQYSSFAQLQDGKAAWVDGGGSADAITASYSIPITSLVDGQLCFVRATAANTTTTPTFSPSALTARTIVKNGGQALVAGDISGDGHELILRYDLTNTRWELLNPKGVFVPFTAASASASASLDLAEDTDNGTNKVTITAAASLASDRVATFPDATGNVVLDTATQTLTNKTLTSPVISTISNTGTITVPTTTGTLALTSQLTSTLTTTNSPSAASESTFTGITGTVQFIFDNITFSNDDVNIQMTTSTNNGSSYDTGASDYQVTRQFAPASASAWTVVGSTASSAIGLNSTGTSSGVGNAAGEGYGRLVVTLNSPNTGGVYKTLQWEGTYINAAGNVVRIQGSAERVSTTAINAVRFAPSAGTFTGTIKMVDIT